MITGVSGGEFGTRGSVTAYDARTGKQRWRFYTIPGPGRIGHDTWPAGSHAWKSGGAPVWQTPSVDPNLGLLYFTTGNAGPDNNGAHRAGKNLFTASMVALDVHTGKLWRWYQMVHHDIWDYDAPSPTVLFDAKVHGETVHGIGEAEKTGWLYLLNRATGKPLFPSPEKPVPQDTLQKTWPTQPFPSYAPVQAAAKAAAGHSQVAAPGAGSGIQHAGATAKTPTKNPTPETSTGKGSAAAGKPLFASNCSTCHGAAGLGGNGGPNLESIPSAKNLQVVIGQVTNGGGGMPAFKGTLTEAQIRDVATYVTSDVTGSK